MLKRLATLLLGIGLIGLGVLFFVAPERNFAVQILMRFWPVFLILAGTVRVAGYLIDRHPRSPIGGMMIAAIGGILLSANLLGDRSLIQILGKYWFWILLAFIAGRVLKQYTHRIEDGVRTNAFAPGAVALMVLILGGGMAANYLVKSGRAGLNLRFGEVGNYIFGDQVPIEDEPPQTFAIASGARLIINNANGDVEVNSAPLPQATARLIKRIRAASEEAAKEAAKNIHLQIASDGNGHQFIVNSTGIQQDFSVLIIITIPLTTAANVEIANALGAVKLAGLSGDHTIRNCERAEVGNNAGRVMIENPRGPVVIAQVEGEVSLINTRRDVALRRVNGALRVKSDDGAVEIEQVEGPATIDATRDVTVRNFRGPLSVTSRQGTISLETSEKLADDVRAVNDRGRIRVSIPKDAGFRLDANAGRSRVRVRGFDGFVFLRQDRSSAAGYNISESAPLVSLRSGGGEIQLRSAGHALAGNDD